jgi:hypothetical protein
VRALFGGSVFGAAVTTCHFTYPSPKKSFLEIIFLNMSPRSRSKHRSMREHVSKRSRRYTVGRRTQYRYDVDFAVDLSNVDVDDFTFACHVGMRLSKA